MNNTYCISAITGGVLLYTLLFASLAVAESDPAKPSDRLWRLCPADFSPLPPLVRDTSIGDDQTTLTLHADHLTATEGKRYDLQGHVQIHRATTDISANSAVVDQTKGELKASGNLRFSTDTADMFGDSGEFYLAEDRGVITNPRYWFNDAHLRGTASSIELLSRDHSKLTNVLFTRCAEGNEDWSLRAASLELDQGENVAIAEHARVAFKGVTIFYWPYLSFPIEGRKTGFLVPDVGDSNVSGYYAGVPYYWNIAPDRDATFTPQFYSERGWQYLTEYRYLNTSGLGRLNVDYLPDDLKTNDARLSVQFSHEGQLATNWQTSLAYRYASDKTYLEDFASDLNTASLTHLERKLQVSRQTDHWQFSGLLQSYQTLDEANASDPYQRLPQIQWQLSAQPLGYGWVSSFRSEWVRFQRAESVEGSRLDLQPSLAWPLQGAAGFWIPKLSWRYTAYDLSGQADGANNQTSRGLPLFTMDSGIFLERDLLFGDQRFTQTLEPRVFYLYVPYREQASLVTDAAGNPAVFDSSLPDLSLDGLFSDNRYSGADRVGDANQVTLALSSRILTDSGRERLSASVGRIYYLDPPSRVTLPDEPPNGASGSAWFADVRVPWTKRIDTRASIVWDGHQQETQRANIKFRYQADEDKIVQLTHRFEKDNLEQAEVSLIWPLNYQWRAAAKWNYSLRDAYTLERFVGLEYDSCCWAFRIVKREFVSGSDQLDLNQNLWLQLELKGLTSVGNKVNELFESDK